MKHPAANEQEYVPLSDLYGAGIGMITMSEGQKWDLLLDKCFNDGWIVLVLESNENPLRAFRRATGRR